jgi:hypothetical protein
MHVLAAPARHSTICIGGGDLARGLYQFSRKIEGIIHESIIRSMDLMENEGD